MLKAKENIFSVCEENSQEIFFDGKFLDFILNA